MNKLNPFGVHSPNRLLLNILLIGLSLTCNLLAKEYPNVIFVITDDQGYGDLSCHGNPVLETPAIDSLYEESIHLTDYHVSPTCAPTRGALMSGHFTNRAGPWHTILGRSFLKEGETTLGEVFQNNGYATGLFGKWHLGDNFPFRPEDRGFQEVVSHKGGGVGQTPDYWDNSYFDDTYSHNGAAKKYNGYCTDVYFQEAKRFIETSIDREKPFLAYISTNAPHGPMHCPDKYWKPYLDKGMNPHVSVFYGMIANIDENVANLRSWLKEKGMSENTIFIFTTDNGTASGNTVYNHNMRGKKGSEYEGGHRVPFFIHWPEGGFKKKRDINEITAHIDVLPTLIDLCGLQKPKNYTFDGVSISPLLNGCKDWPNRIIITDSQRVLNPIKWKNCAIMSNDWRLVNGKELYEIKNDPEQKFDVSSKHPEQVETMRLSYERWWASMEESFKQPARIKIGNPAENPSHLTAHDWMMEKGKVAWHQSHIRKGEGDLGYWSLNVEETGHYKISISRYPREANTPISSSLKPGDPVPGLVAYRESPGVGFHVQKAIIKVNDKAISKSITGNEKEVHFKTKLTKGPLKLASLFEDKEGKKFSAYYAYVEKL